MRKFNLFLIAMTFCLALFYVGSSRASGDNKASLTYSKHIAPLFMKNCMSCHRQGEIAPMALTSYKEIRPWAKSIREKIIAREMPPWHADSAHGKWANDRRMSKADIDTIVKWIDGGAIEGNAKDLPPMPKFATGWQIGEPDQIFQMPVEFTVPAQGSVAYQYFTVPSNFTEDKYIEAMEARAGNLAVVHHIVIYVRDPNKKREKNKRLDLGEDLLGALSPGQTPFKAQPGMAKLIKAGSQIVFQMHYTPNGTESKDRSVVGFKFAKKPVDKVVTTTAAFDIRFVIPPGAANHEVAASYEVEQDMHIVSFSPHMHLRGKDILYKATYPDGRSEILLSVPRYNFNWQVYYYPEKPIALPKGSRIDVLAHFDNSTANKMNPDPTKAVRFGEQTWDEMMNGFFDYTLDHQSLQKQSPAMTGKTATAGKQ
jgi:hypothetical protein